MKFSALTASATSKVIISALSIGIVAGSGAIAVRTLAKNGRLPNLNHILPFSLREESDTVELPCYSTLTLKADTVAQTVSLENPSCNTCYLVMTLSLADGTRLWKSKPIGGGNRTAPMVLEQPLSAGTYEGATLHFACFADAAAQVPLNSAKTTVRLLVK